MMGMTMDPPAIAIITGAIMTDPISAYLLFVAAVSAGFLSPGPNIVAVMATAMSAGRSAALRMAAGAALGTGVWAGLAVGGLAGLLAAHAALFLAAKLLGAGYLFWLAVKAFRSAARREAAAPSPAAARGSRRPLRAGLTVQLSNPKAALHWTAISALALSPEATPPYGAVLVGTAIGLSLLGHGAYALAFSTRGATAVYRRLRRVIEAGLGAFYALIGLKLLCSAR